MFQPSKGQSSGSKTDTFQQQVQQIESPDVKFSSLSSVCCVNLVATVSHMAGD